MSGTRDPVQRFIAVWPAVLCWLADLGVKVRVGKIAEYTKHVQELAAKNVVGSRVIRPTQAPVLAEIATFVSIFEARDRLQTMWDFKRRRLAFACDGLSLYSASSKQEVGSSRVDLQACKLEYSIVSPK